MPGGLGTMCVVTLPCPLVAVTMPTRGDRAAHSNRLCADRLAAAGSKFGNVLNEVGRSTTGSGSEAQVLPGLETGRAVGSRFGLWRRPRSSGERPRAGAPSWRPVPKVGLLPRNPRRAPPRDRLTLAGPHTRPGNPGVEPKVRMEQDATGHGARHRSEHPTGAVDKWGGCVYLS